MDKYQKLVGQSHFFDDGSELRVLEVKMRDTGYWVTYYQIHPNCLERKLNIPYNEFIDSFSHLFNVEE